MNVSSLVISTHPPKADNVIGKLKESGLCEYHAHNEGKIIVTIEGESVSDEVAIMNQLKQLEHVVSIEMIYSYCEDELEQEKEHLEIEGKIPEWLNDESAKAEDIKYNGRLPL